MNFTNFIFSWVLAYVFCSKKVYIVGNINIFQTFNANQLLLFKISNVESLKEKFCTKLPIVDIIDQMGSFVPQKYKVITFSNWCLIKQWNNCLWIYNSNIQSSLYYNVVTKLYRKTLWRLKKRMEVMQLLESFYHWQLRRYWRVDGLINFFKFSQRWTWKN